MDPSQQPVDLSASILSILQAVGAILSALITLGTLIAPIFPSWKNVDSKLRPVMERLGFVVRTVEGFRFSIPFTRYVFKGKLGTPPASILLVFILSGFCARAYADQAPAPQTHPLSQYTALATDSDGKLRVALVDTTPSAPADVKAQPSEPTAVVEPPKKLPTIAEVAACTLSAIPGVVTDCVIGGNYKGPAVDSRVFWTTLGVGAGNSILAIGAFLAAHYIPISNDAKQ